MNAGALPVASTILNTGNAYASTAPRLVPKFTATGQPIADAQVQPATSNQTSTTVTALAISKTEPSPEAKLLRGVHEHAGVYTLTVSNTARAATNGVTVTDYLPAAEEFLGCGQVDNSAGVEYPGAPSLTTTPPVGANCPAPASVDTVANPPADGIGQLPGRHLHQGGLEPRHAEPPARSSPSTTPPASRCGRTCCSPAARPRPRSARPPTWATTPAPPPGRSAPLPG